MGGKRTGEVRARKRANAWCLRTTAVDRDLPRLSRFPRQVWCVRFVARAPQHHLPLLDEESTGSWDQQKPTGRSLPQTTEEHKPPRVASKGRLKWTSRRKAGADERGNPCAQLLYLITLYCS
ncbi:hypothetical protein PpBr36_00129 [Pyricularia pennisetigena]|uniref:hypothetical protein n=1 Tax=Pyricularia pennisetigena TaxID=1578925 RepID=UPI001154290D|nr:hypothetical protein PpBr36_00129 [Pyricularia pennisetigena]TLS29239.1 hypothetical protein PpBr36_00129 [Pyricularia pennisetigena]